MAFLNDMTVNRFSNSTAVFVPFQLVSSILLIYCVGKKHQTGESRSESDVDYSHFALPSEP